MMCLAICLSPLLSRNCVKSPEIRVSDGLVGVSWPGEVTSSCRRVPVCVVVDGPTSPRCCAVGGPVAPCPSKRFPFRVVRRSCATVRCQPLPNCSLRYCFRLNENAESRDDYLFAPFSSSLFRDVCN